MTLPPGLQKRVDAYLMEYISGKRKSMDVFSRSSSNASIATDESLFEQSEPLPHSKASMERVFWQRSLEMRDKQHTWQVQLPIQIDRMILLCTVNIYVPSIFKATRVCGYSLKCLFISVICDNLKFDA